MIDCLRLSVTDQCNLNCLYCTPKERMQFLASDEILHYDEMARMVRVLVPLGVNKIRLTGGEPLVKKDITCLISMLSGIKGIEDLSLTTNGKYLKEMAADLKQAGLNRINISIDSMKRDNYTLITGIDCLDQVWEGILESVSLGLEPVKLNVVVMKGINDDEVIDFARLTKEYPLTVRFIEFFPTSKRAKDLICHTIPNEEIRHRLSRHFGRLENGSVVKGNGPAVYYKIKDAKGQLGFISSYSRNFCNECNRVRIDSAGRLFPCLFSGPICDVGKILREGKTDAQMAVKICDVFSTKENYNKSVLNDGRIEMSHIGG